MKKFTVYDIANGKLIFSLLGGSAAVFFLFYLWQPIIINNSVKKDAKVSNAAIILEKKLETPKIVRAIYLTSFSAGNKEKINYTLGLANDEKINSVVVDIKDFSGYINYDTALPEAELYGSKKIIIPEISELIKTLHKKNIYAIAKIAVFQDPVLASARNDLALKNKNTGNIWRDAKGLSWVDPASEEVWQYNINIAKEATENGFDEINFDYIRFPTDGRLSDISYPVWDKTTQMQQILKGFYEELRKNMPDDKLSANLFGFAATQTEDFGVGQVIEDAFEYFDFISPMLYPSHYPPGYLDYKNPAEHPYEIVKFAMDNAVQRLNNYEKNEAVIRPWIQDFDLGAFYDKTKIIAQIQAIKDAAGEDYAGFMLWNARNVYTDEALRENKLGE